MFNLNEVIANGCTCSRLDGVVVGKLCTWCKYEAEEAEEVAQLAAQEDADRDDYYSDARREDKADYTLQG